MKKLLLLLGMFTLVGTLMIGCSKDDPEKPNIRVGFSYLPEDPIAGEEITFTNASTGGSSVEWTFGDDSYSSDNNPKHTFESDGAYEVTLTVDGNEDLVFTKTVNVGKQIPTYSADQQVIQKAAPVTLTASVYNPDEEEVAWKWEFPAGKVKGEGIDENGVATTQEVVVVFTDSEENDGFEVKLTATINGVDYPSTLRIVVKNQLAKTLFIGEKDGNVYSYKLYAEGEAELVDLGIGAGAHALTLQYTNDRLYVFNAGSKITYTADAEAEAGSIVSFLSDGTDYKTHMNFGTASAYDDAYFGYVDDSYIYWTDRRNDVTRIPVDQLYSEGSWPLDAGGDGNPEAYPSLVANSLLGYYGQGIGWGNVNGSFRVYNDQYWWAKNSNGKGIWRFTDDDINASFPEGGYTPDDMPSAGGILTDYPVRAFVIDEVNEKIYFSCNKITVGFYVCDIDGSNVTLIDESPADVEGGDNEATFITGIVVDNEAGKVYWAYRGPENDASGEPINFEDSANALLKSGIKSFNLDGSGDVEYLVEDIVAYGLAIDNALK